MIWLSLLDSFYFLSRRTWGTTTRATRGLVTKRRGIAKWIRAGEKIVARPQPFPSLRDEINSAQREPFCRHAPS